MCLLCKAFILSKFVFSFPELYGWPMLTPLKIQMQKCDKCSLEFCSTVNYRRHIRVHRRLKVDKVFLLLLSDIIFVNTNVHDCYLIFLAEMLTI